MGSETVTPSPHLSCCRWVCNLISTTPEDFLLWKPLSWICHIRMRALLLSVCGRSTLWSTGVPAVSHQTLSLGLVTFAPGEYLLIRAQLTFSIGATHCCQHPPCSPALATSSSLLSVIRLLKQFYLDPPGWWPENKVLRGRVLELGWEEGAGALVAEL